MLLQFTDNNHNGAVHLLTLTQQHRHLTIKQHFSHTFTPTFDLLNKKKRKRQARRFPCEAELYKLYCVSRCRWSTCRFVAAAHVFGRAVFYRGPFSFVEAASFCGRAKGSWFIRVGMVLIRLAFCAAWMEVKACVGQKGPRRLAAGVAEAIISEDSGRLVWFVLQASRRGEKDLTHSFERNAWRWIIHRGINLEMNFKLMTTDK